MCHCYYIYIIYIYIYIYIKFESVASKVCVAEVFGANLALRKHVHLRHRNRWVPKMDTHGCSYCFHGHPWNGYHWSGLPVHIHAHSKICKQLVFQCTKGPTYTGIEESWPRGGATS
jgi:hypothetical protein